LLTSATRKSRSALWTSANLYEEFGLSIKSLFAQVQNILVEQSPGSAHALARAHTSVNAGQSLVDALIENGFSAKRVGAALAQVYQLPFKPYVDFSSIDRRLLSRISSDYLKSHRMLPLRYDRDGLVVAVTDPSHYYPLDDLGILFQAPVCPIIMPLDVLWHALSRVREDYRSRAEGPIIKLEEEQLDTSARELSQERPDLLEWDCAPIVKLVNALMWEVVAERASTVRFEPHEQELRVSYQSESRWYDLASAPKSLADLITSCLKVMAGLSSQKTQRPREGRLRLRVGTRALEMRASVVPARFGEWISLDFDGLGAHRNQTDHVIYLHPQLISGSTHLISGSTLVPKSTRCARCGEEIVVRDARFCKECGFRLPVAGIADQLAFSPSAALPVAVARNEWRLS
jgi:hypothetical protein